MNAIHKTVVSTKNFVVAHKTAVAVAATAMVCFAANRAALNDHNEFLKENGLYDAYYAPTED